MCKLFNINCLHNILIEERNRIQKISENIYKKMNNIQSSKSLLELNSANNLNNIKYITVLLGVNTTFRIINDKKWDDVKIERPSFYYIVLHFEGVSISVDLLNCMINITNNSSLAYDFIYDFKYNQTLETEL